ncbi:zinc knuckle CX2CX4HX4C containing protein [Tanacetum coccineum]
MRIAKGAGRQVSEVFEMFQEYKRLAINLSNMKKSECRHTSDKGVLCLEMVLASIDVACPLFGLTNGRSLWNLEALGSICNSIKVDRNNADVTISFCLWTSTSQHHMLELQFRFLLNIMYGKNNWAKHGLKRIMMNSKGFFFFKFDSRAGLEAVLEGGPWLIRKPSIILKKWLMDTRLLKEELTRIPICVKLHDVPIQVFKEDVVSPPIVATSNVVTPNAEKTNDGFQTVGKTKKRKGKSKSTNGGQFTGPSVKHNVRYEPKATTSAPKKGTTYVGYTSQSTPMLKTTGNSSKKDNLSMSNSFFALNEEEEEDEEDEEDVENVYDESANLIQNTKAGGSSSFTAAAG